MAISIVKTDSRGAYRMVAECDLYLDQTMTKVITVKDGDSVPKEAAFVLAGKGGTIPARYKALVEGLETAEVDKAKPKAEPAPEPAKPLPQVPLEPEAEVAPEPEAQPAPEPKPAKSKKQ